MLLSCAAAATMMLQALAAPGIERKVSELGSNLGSLRLGNGMLFSSHSLVRIAVLFVMRLDSSIIVEAIVKKLLGNEQAIGKALSRLITVQVVRGIYPNNKRSQADDRPASRRLIVYVIMFTFPRHLTCQISAKYEIGQYRSKGW